MPYQIAWDEQPDNPNPHAVVLDGETFQTYEAALAAAEAAGSDYDDPRAWGAIVEVFPPLATLSLIRTAISDRAALPAAFGVETTEDAELYALEQIDGLMAALSPEEA